MAHILQSSATLYFILTPLMFYFDIVFQGSVLQILTPLMFYFDIVFQGSVYKFDLI
jgi:hypothetical protein